MAPKPTPNISIVPPLVKARKQWYRWKHSGHWKERARMGPGILSPRSSQVGQSLLSEFARMVLTIVGPERLATIKMVDDQQNVDLVCLPLIGWELHFTGFDPPSFRVWPLRSNRCAIESRDKSLVKSVDPMAHKPIPISGGALLNWSGWVLGPWDLRITPNFYSCFQ